MQKNTETGILAPIKQRRFLTFGRLIYLPRILNPREKKWFILILIIFVLSGAGFFGSIYFKITHAVPQNGKSYVEGILREPRAINPVYAALDPDRDLERLVFSRLLNYTGEGKIEMDLAEKYEIGEEGKSYTIYLKRGVKWHDGENLGVDDILFTVKMIQNPQYKSPLRANWQGVTVEKIDDYAVKFTLRSAYSPFIENLTIGILPQHLWEGIGPEQAALHELNLKPIGSGPYQFDKLKQNKDGSLVWYRLKRNTNYYREGPYLSYITFYFFGDEEKILTAWRKGIIEGFGPVNASLVSEINQEKIKLASIQMPRIFGLFFNEKNSPLLADKSVRKAMALAIDKKSIASLVSAGGSQATDSFLPPSSPGYTNDITQYNFNPEESRLLLKEAGWKDENEDGILEKKRKEKGKEVTDELRFVLSTSDWPDLVKTAELIRENLQGIGIGIEISIKPFNELETLVIRPRQFSILLFGQVYGYEPDPFAFWHSSQIRDPGLNLSLYSNKKTDALFESARKESDLSKREEKYREAQKIIAEDLPAIFLYSQLYLYMVPANLKGAEISKISLPSDRLNEINKWHKKTKRVLK